MAAAYKPGVYWCEITEQALSESKNGNPMLVFKIKPYAHQDETPVERSIERTVRKAITEKSIEYVIEDLRYLGFDRHSFAEIDPRHPSHFSFVGIKSTFACKEGEWNGNVKDEWSIYQVFESAEVEPIDKTKLKRLDGLFGKMLKDAPIVKPPAAPAPVAPPATPKGQFVNDQGVTVDDDDLPF
jgi:hypothetical protein